MNMYQTQSFLEENWAQRYTDRSEENLEQLCNIEPYTVEAMSGRLLLNLAKNTFKRKTVLPVQIATSLHSESASSSILAHNYCQAKTFSSKSAEDAEGDDCVESKQNLLTFPAFPLSETIDRFLKSCQPLLTKEEFDATTKAAMKFCEKDGRKLQEILEKVAENEQNWLAPRWLKAAYLQYRDPVTVYSSPGHAFPLQKFKNESSFVNYAGKTIYAMLRYKKQVDAGDIPVLKMGKQELDNSQFSRVYGTCRVPGVKEDKVRYYPKSKHVVVIYKNNFYKLPVYNKEGALLNTDTITNELKQIIKNGTKEGPPIGILSTDKRDRWAKAYEVLISKEENFHSVRDIQRALFTVSLDKCFSHENDEALHKNMEQLIHGGGSKLNSANRWMDKTIQLCINPNGMSGFCYEHSPAEGQPIAVMCDYVVENLNCSSDDFFDEGAYDDYEAAKKLNFDISPCLDKYLEQAKEHVDGLAKDLQVYVLRYKNYGKEVPKQFKLSPDSYIQMAFQLAFYRIHKQPGAQYESAHLRIYYNGRTETIRSCSNESVAFAKAMLDSKAKPEQRKDLLRKAVNAHREYTQVALQGRGVDRHLLGLKLMAIEKGLPIPEFYKSPGFVKSANFRISTSQVYSPNEAFMSYGPLTKDGYACCYNPRKDDIFLGTTAWRSNKETDAKKFAEAIATSLDEMKALMSSGDGDKKSAKSKL